MANGIQLAEQNFQAFCSWRSGKTDNDLRQLVSRGCLSRKEIVKECGFSKSSLDQNPRIKAALAELENELRGRDVLPPTSVSDFDSKQSLMREPGNHRILMDAERLRRLEHEVAGLKAENSELKRLLGKFAILSEALQETGRLPR